MHDTRKNEIENLLIALRSASSSPNQPLSDAAINRVIVNFSRLYQYQVTPDNQLKASIKPAINNQITQSDLTKEDFNKLQDILHANQEKLAEFNIKTRDQTGVLNKMAALVTNKSTVTQKRRPSSRPNSQHLWSQSFWAKSNVADKLTQQQKDKKIDENQPYAAPPRRHKS